MKLDSLAGLITVDFLTPQVSASRDLRAIRVQRAILALLGLLDLRDLRETPVPLVRMVLLDLLDRRVLRDLRANRDLRVFRDPLDLLGLRGRLDLRGLLVRLRNRLSQLPLAINPLGLTHPLHAPCWQRLLLRTPLILWVLPTLISLLNRNITDTGL